MTYMIWKHGKEVPVHRRFNKEEAEEHVRNRYRTAKEHISKQVIELQTCKEFCEICSQLYIKGYHDWIILSVILNCMLNWRAQERRIPLTPEYMHENMNVLLSDLDNLVYPCAKFMGAEFDINLKMHFATVLVTWGFQFRRHNLSPEVIEEFLRIRMKHFDYDLPHEKIFGTPPGCWPESY